MDPIDTILVFLSGLLITFIALGWYFSGRVVKPKIFTSEFALTHEIEEGKINPVRFEALPKEEIMIQSTFGYPLVGLWFPVDGSSKTIVLCHGIGWNLYGSVKYMDIFHQRGFNVLMYDHRNHGRSGRKNTTFGYYEKFDLKSVLDWVEQRVGMGSLIGTHGESLGAAVALQHTSIDPRAAFTIADCPFSDLTRLLKFRLQEDYYLPAFPLLNIANLFSRLRTGMSFQDVSPVRDLVGVSKPIFLIHGRLDSYIPPEMSEEMYVQNPETRRLYLVSGAGHAQAYWQNREEYDRQIGEFLEECVRESV